MNRNYRLAITRKCLVAICVAVFLGLGLSERASAQSLLPIQWIAGQILSPQCLAYSPDGALLAVGGTGGIQIYGASTGALLKSIPTAANISVNSIAFSPDGKTLADGGTSQGFLATVSSGVVEIWTVSTAQLVATLKTAPNQVVNSVCFSPDGLKLADGGNITSNPYSSFIEIWNVSTDKLIENLNSSATTINSVAFSPDGTLLADGGRTLNPVTNQYAGVLETWNVVSGAMAASFATAENRGTLSVAFSPNGKLLAAGGMTYNSANGSTGSALEFWNLAQAKLSLTTIPTPNLGVSTVAFSPDGRSVATGGTSLNGFYSGQLQLWDVASGALVGSNTTSVNFAFGGVAFSPDGKTIADCGQAIDSTNTYYGSVLETWDFSNGSLNSRQTTTSYINSNSIAFSPNGQVLVQGGGVAPPSANGRYVQGVLNLWNVATGQAPVSLDTAAIEVFGVAFSPVGSTLASCGQTYISSTGNYQAVVELWNSSTHTLIGTINPGAACAFSVVFSPDGKSLAVGGGSASHGSGVLELYDVATGKLLYSLPTANNVSVNSVAFSPDGKFVAAGGVGYSSSNGISTSTLELWKVSNGTLANSFMTTAAIVNSIAFSQDGTSIADGGYAATNTNRSVLELWGVSTGKQLSVLPLVSGSVGLNSVSFSGDGKVLFAAALPGLQVFSTTTYKQLNWYADNAVTATVSPNSSLVACWLLTGALEIAPNPYFVDLVESIGFSSNSVSGGNAATGTVTLIGLAGPNGAVVTLASGSSIASVPSMVSVPAGQSTANFTVSTLGVNAPTTVPISATLNGQTTKMQLNVLPATVESISVSSTSTKPVTGIVQLNGVPGPAGAHVLISSSNPAVSVPASISIKAGQSSGGFAVTFAPVSAVTTVTIIAKLGASSASTTITLAPPVLVSVSFSPTTIVGGGSASGTLTLSGPTGKGGMVVKLMSNLSSAVAPVSVTIAAGKSSGTFSVKTVAVGAQSVATVTASVGTSSISANLTIQAPALKSLTLSPTKVAGGKSSTGTLTITSPAPAGGLVITLSSNSTSASVPQSVTVPAGKTSVSFTVLTSKSDATVLATITGTTNGASKTATVTIT